MYMYAYMYVYTCIHAYMHAQKKKNLYSFEEYYKILSKNEQIEYLF